jgi:hypothetical protein
MAISIGFDHCHDTRSPHASLDLLEVPAHVVQVDLEFTLGRRFTSVGKRGGF